MRLTAEACKYAMDKMATLRTPLSRAEAQGVIAEAYLKGMLAGVELVTTRRRKWRQRQKSLQR
jgi:hypothetical protein